MYKGELTIFPSAQEDHPDLSVELLEVPGIYKACGIRRRRHRCRQTATSGTAARSAG